MNIQKIRGKLVILSFYLVSGFFYYFGINRNVINYFILFIINHFHFLVDYLCLYFLNLYFEEIIYFQIFIHELFYTTSNLREVKNV